MNSEAKNGQITCQHKIINSTNQKISKKKFSKFTKKSTKFTKKSILTTISAAASLALLTGTIQLIEASENQQNKLNSHQIEEKFDYEVFNSLRELENENSFDLIDDLDQNSENYLPNLFKDQIEYPTATRRKKRETTDKNTDYNYNENDVSFAYTKNSRVSVSVWARWTSWSQCSESCGSDSVRFRYRICRNEQSGLREKTTLCSSQDNSKWIEEVKDPCQHCK